MSLLLCSVIIQCSRSASMGNTSGGMPDSGQGGGQGGGASQVGTDECTCESSEESSTLAASSAGNSPEVVTEGAVPSGESNGSPEASTNPTENTANNGSEPASGDEATTTASPLPGGGSLPEGNGPPGQPSQNGSMLNIDMMNGDNGMPMR